MSVMEPWDMYPKTVMIESSATAQQEVKPTRYITAEDYEAQKLWRDVALQNIALRGTSATVAIVEADSIAQAYIKFVNNQENK